MSTVDAPVTLLGEWADLVASTLVELGLRDVVISPGSRSTPFVIALTERTELRVLDVLDERAAGFVALGIARVTGRPVALLCTSGTAPAHWYPAIIEASLTDVPLVCLSADRPFEHTHCGAAQTIDQIGLFGSHVRFFAEVGAPDASESALRGLRRTVAQAYALSCGPRPGPVHLNLRARKPLEPRPPREHREHALHERVLRIAAQPVTRATRPELHPTGDDLAFVASLVARSERPLLVAGPLDPKAAHDGTREAVLALARHLDAPLYAEATSQLRFAPGRDDVRILDDLDLALRAPEAEADAPDLVIALGATVTSGALERFLAARPELPRVVLGVPRWIDSHGTAAAMVIADRVPTLRALLAALPAREALVRDEAWRERWAARQDAACRAVAREVEVGPFGEGTVARILVETLPEDAVLSLGNSLSVRTIDRFARSSRSLVVCSQRGANGIDGLVSGALGAALATERPSALLLGDLSFLHDLGGLANARYVRTPLAIVVLQNGGGRIFEQLPVATLVPHAMPHFLTPHAVDLAHAAALFSLPFRRADSERSLREALDAALAHPGVTIVEALVPPHGVRDADARLFAQVRGKA